MKVQIEGSDRDIRGLFNDIAAAKEAAAAQLRNENLEKELADARTKMEEALKEAATLKQTLSAAAQKFGEMNSSNNALRMELGAKNAHIAMQDSEIQKLKFVMSDPVRLSADQEAQVEALYQKMVEQYNIKPIVVTPPEPGKPISAEYVVSTILGCLGNGDKVGACKEIRAATGLSLLKTKNLVDKALLAFGCRVGERGNPLPVIGPNADKTAAKPADTQG